MLSARAGKWLFVLVLVLLALYAAYPPVEYPIEKTRVTEKVATTAEEAADHNVKIGETYVVEKKRLWKRFLPLAAGKKDERVKVLERKEDGTVVEEVTTVRMGRIKLGLDIAGGTELVYQLKLPQGERLGGKLSETISILKERIDPTNVKEFRIQSQGQDRILIQVPKASVDEVKRLKERMTRMGKLEFKLAVPRGVDKEKDEWYQRAEQGKAVKGYEKLYRDNDPTKDFYLVKAGEPEITGKYLASVYPTQDQYGRPAVGFSFDSAGSRTFAMVTEKNKGWLLAIILDGVLRSAPVIRTRIAGAGIIEGNFTGEEVDQMVTILHAGSLPVDVELLQESTVGPKLGMDSVRKGLRSIIVGGLLVVTFIGIYYLACGLVADGALVLNLVLLVGVLGLLGAALTLPGMAGILLTVGIAVDANVLIFERIREETAAGKPVRVALRNGYDRAYTTIVDANVTTLLTAVILYIVGTGPVRGFAVTLSVGIVLSMFTALFVTRLAFESLVAKGWLKEFKMFRFVKEPSLSFSSKRRFAYVLSSLVLVIGLVAFFARGSALYDIDFTGGSLAYLSLGKPVPADEVRARLAKAGFERAEVQEIGTESATAEGTTDFAVRIKGIGIERVKQVVRPAIRRKLEEAGLLGRGSVAVSADGRSLELKLEEPVEELKLRKALAGNGKDPMDLEYVSRIVAPEKVRAERFSVHFPQGGSPPEEHVLWGKVRVALSWAGLKRDTYSVETGEILTPGESTEGPATGALLKLKLDGPVQAQLLATELDRRGFADLDVKGPSPALEFEIAGPRQVLEKLKDEMPATLELPRITIGERTMSAQFEEPISEQDLMAHFEQHELGEALLVPLGVGSRSYRLVLSSEPVKEKMIAAFADLRGEAEPLQKIVSIGSTVAQEMKGRALLAVVFASVIIVLYIAVRFHAFKFGIAAVIALVHDVLIAVGLVALADWSGALGDIKINLAMLAAFLTIMGYSLNDTIVVFDRIRENMVEMSRTQVDAEVIDKSVNQTLSRTLLTSLTTLMVVATLYVLGGAVLKGLAFTLIIGVVVGTYSSVFIASPVLLDWEGLKKGVSTFFKILFFPLAAPFKLVGLLRGVR